MPGIPEDQTRLTWDEPVFLFPVRRDLEHFAVYRVHRREGVVCVHDEGYVDFARALAY